MYPKGCGGSTPPSPTPSGSTPRALRHARRPPRVVRRGPGHLPPGAPSCAPGAPGGPERHADARVRDPGALRFPPTPGEDAPGCTTHGSCSSSVTRRSAVWLGAATRSTCPASRRCRRDGRGPSARSTSCAPSRSAPPARSGRPRRAGRRRPTSTALKERARELKDRIREAEEEVEAAEAALRDLLLDDPQPALRRRPRRRLRGRRRRGPPRRRRPRRSIRPARPRRARRGDGHPRLRSRRQALGRRGSASRAARARCSSGRWRRSSSTLHTGRHGYTEFSVPYLVTGTTMTGTGQLPKFADGPVPHRHRRARPLAHPHRRGAAHRRCTPTRSSTPSRCRAPTRRGRRASAPRPAPTAATPAASCGCTSSPRSSWCGSAPPRSRTPSSRRCSRHAEACLQELGLAYRVVRLRGRRHGVQRRS